jgi:5-methyltetrahydrofolate--homocysteine methyltransferase
MDELRSAIKEGDGTKTVQELKRLLSCDHSANELLEVMIESLRKVGEAFSKGEAYIPEMLIAAKAMQEGVDFLGPHLVEEGVKRVGKCLIGTVSGDLHDVGKNLVALVLKGNGFEVIDLGVDLSLKKLLDSYRQHNPDILGLSALLTTTMQAMKQAVNEVKRVFPDAKVMVGGAPVTQEFAVEIGADGYAADAGAAVDVALKLVRK